MRNGPVLAGVRIKDVCIVVISGHCSATVAM